MDDTASTSARNRISCRGEVWTDARGIATVRLPSEAADFEPPIEYALSDLDPPSRARVTAELRSGRFTIVTDEPHIKVAWRITGNQPQGRKGEDR
jgi:hypothetical protein